MRRVTLMLVAMAVMVPLFAVVAYAAAGGNAANAHKCEEGGYLDYTDAQGNPFKNEGQCTRYAARGGQLVPVPVSTADISLDQAAGTISGTGFTPNSEVVITRTYTPGGGPFSSPVSTDATGAFVDSGYVFCFDAANTSVEVTATDAAGVTVTESFPLSCG
jgi:hypothetical protein